MARGRNSFLHYHVSWWSIGRVAYDAYFALSLRLWTQDQKETLSLPSRSMFGIQFNMGVDLVDCYIRDQSQTMLFKIIT